MLKDDRRELPIREIIVGNGLERTFVNGLTPKQRRELMYRLQIELARANPTFHFFVDPLTVPIMVKIPINSSFNADLLQDKLNELDFVTVVLQKTFMLWAEEHGYEPPPR